jgi:hypothetical protein
MIFNRQNVPLFLGCCLVALLFIVTANNSFFWDTVQLGSKHANFYYTNNFRYLLLPDSIDSGHMPAFGMVLALMWKIAGRTLIVSHLTMLPFIIGILWQLNKLTKRFIPGKYAGWAFLLVLADPTLLSQICLVSPDIPLVFFFLLGLNSLIDNRKILLSISILFLFLTSMRGVMVSFCLFILDVLRNISLSQTLKQVIGPLIKRSIIYLPAILVLISFGVIHYAEKGWVGVHSDSPWAGSFERVGFKGVVFNIGVLGWRLIDFGRIGIWIVFAILWMKYKRRLFKHSDTRFLMLIFMVLLVFLPLNMIWAKNLLGHRYLLPIFIAFALLSAHILFTLEMNKKIRAALVGIWLMALITGNFWVYPEKISQGWDATLAHLPYYKIRHQAMDYADRQNIGFGNVQSFFPNVAVVDDIDLNKDYRQLMHFNNDLEYVLYSNVFNISDEAYNLITSEYVMVKQFKQGRIYFNVYKKSN